MFKKLGLSWSGEGVGEAVLHVIPSSSLIGVLNFT